MRPDRGAATDTARQRHRALGLLLLTGARSSEVLTRERKDFDMTEALLTISIAMLGITSLTQKKWLLYFSSIVALIGIIFGLAAFFKISLHSDVISRILG